MSNYINDSIDNEIKIVVEQAIQKIYANKLRVLIKGDGKPIRIDVVDRSLNEDDKNRQIRKDCDINELITILIIKTFSFYLSDDNINKSLIWGINPYSINVKEYKGEEIYAICLRLNLSDQPATKEKRFSI